MHQTNKSMPATENPESEKALFEEWSQNQFINVQKFCRLKGTTVSSVIKEKSLCLPSLVGIWYVNAVEKNESFWVINGKLPSDIAKSDIAKNAREAMRYFSMSWQLRAARLEESIAEGKVAKQNKETQEKVIKELVAKAELLAEIIGRDELWVNLK